MARAVLDFDDFDNIDPAPDPPEVIRPGNVRSLDVEDKKYLKAMDDWGTRRTNWMILKSLEATDGLEWETINMSDPNTWDNFRKELKECGFTLGEVGRLILAVTEVCGLNQDKIDEATARFLAEQAATPDVQSSPSGGPQSIQYGRLVNV